MTKRGEVQKKVLDAIDDKWLTRIQIREITKDDYRSITEALNAMYKQGIVERDDTPDINGRKELRFRRKVSHREVSPEYLKLIIENYNSKNIKKREMAEKEIIALGLDKSNTLILDKNFIDFIIKNMIKYFVKNYSSADYPYPFEEIFDTIVLQLKRGDLDRQKELLMYIQKQFADVLKECIMEESTDYFKKEVAIDNLVTIGYPAFAVVFDFLKIMKCENSIAHLNKTTDVNEKTDGFLMLFDCITEIIKSYSEINLVDCKKRLWDAYDKQKNKWSKENIYYLIDLTSLGYNIVNQQYKENKEKYLKMH